MKRTLYILLSLTLCLFQGYSEENLTQLLLTLEQAQEERDLARKAFLKLQEETQNRIEALSSTQETLRRNVEEADRSMLELQTEATQSSAAAAQARQELEQRNTELASLKQELERTRDRVSELEQLPPTQRRDYLVEEMQRRLGQQLIEITRAEYGKQQAVAELGELEALNRELRTALRTTRKTESLNAAKLSALESRLDTLNREVTTLTKERDALLQEQVRLQKVVNDLNVRLEEAQNYTRTEEEVTALEQSLSAATSEVQRLAAELEARKEIPDLREAFSAMELERDQLRATRKALYAKLEDLETKLREQEEAFTNAQEELIAKNKGLERTLREETSKRSQREQALASRITDLETQLRNQRVPNPPPPAPAMEQAQVPEPSPEQDAIPEEVLTSRLERLKQALERERETSADQQEALLAKVDELNADLRKEREGRQNERELRRGLEAELGRERDTRQQLERNIRRLESGLELAGRAGAEEAELAEVGLLVEKLRQENELLKKESLDARGDVDQLMSELNDQNSRQGMQIRELQTMLGEQMIELTEAQRKIEALEARTVSYEKLKAERTGLIQARDKARRDMKVLAKHIYDLREQVAQNEEMKAQLAATSKDRERLKQEMARKERLTEALRAEQERKDRQILDLMKRIAAERPQPTETEDTEAP